MNITINIDDTQMSKLVNDGINALDDVTVKNIAKQSLCEAFKDSELSKLILFEKRGIYADLELRQWAKNAISQSLTEDDFKQFKEIVFAAIAEHAKDIIVETLAQTLTNNLFTYENQHNFSERLVRAIEEQRK